LVYRILLQQLTSSWLKNCLLLWILKLRSLVHIPTANFCKTSFNVTIHLLCIGCVTRDTGS
jgi:hypothetical protein